MKLNDISILIIDDSTTIRSYLQNVLLQKGARIVQSAATAQEGLALCAEHSYDLILVDLFLPDTDGIAVVKEIRATNDVSTIVMITGYGGIKSAIAAVQMGADGYIEKKDVTSTLRDHIDFLYALDQAMEHRAGLVAQKQLEQIRADLYAMVTHDLRNPTTAILMATDMLLKEDLEPPQQRQIVMMIDDAAHRLIRLINDYLDFAKIDEGYLRLELGLVDLAKLVESNARFAHLQAQAKQQTLILSVPPVPVMARADAERLKQVLDNLLSNAIKYTPPNGRITLRLEVEDQQAVLSVSDTGRGIPSEHLPKLFTKYFRVPGDATHGILGTGLGLLVVKEIVEAHSGTIEVQSEGVAGKGTTFIIRLPLLQKAGAGQTDASRSSDRMDGATAQPQGHGLLAQDPKLRELFWKETHEHLSVLQEAFAFPHLLVENQELLHKARHASHTLKGNAGAVQLDVLYDLAAQLDGKLQQAARGSQVLAQADLDEMKHLLDRIVSVVASEQNG